MDVERPVQPAALSLSDDECELEESESYPIKVLIYFLASSQLSHRKCRLFFIGLTLPPGKLKLKSLKQNTCLDLMVDSRKL